MTSAAILCAALSEVEVFARTLAGEAENQGWAGMQGVASVIMKRVALRWKGDVTARAVCLHRMQFSCWNDGVNPDRDRILAIQPGNDPEYQDCLSIAKQALDGTLLDNTCGADSYEVTNSGAYWAQGLTPVAVIGKHSFYVTRFIPPVAATSTGQDELA